MSSAPEVVSNDDSGLRLRKNITTTIVENLPGSQEEIARDTKPPKPEEENKLNALQQHSAFFDRNRDGKITLSECYQAWRAIGFGIFLSAVFAWTLNAGLAWPTSDGWLPTTTINLKNIHRSNHGSDTGAYTEEGDFNEDKFSEVFDKFDSDKDGYWTWGDAWRRLKAQRKAFDPFGWFASFLEFGVTFYVCAENGKLSKEVLKGVYDGTLFYQLEQRQNEMREAKKQRRIDQKEAKKAAKEAKKHSKKQESAGPSH